MDADEEIVEVAALLHDIAGIKDRDNYENHHLVGVKEAERILRGFRYPQEKIEEIKHYICIHRGSKSARAPIVRAF